MGIMNINYPTLAHFRHFSSLYTNLCSTTVENVRQITPFYAKQTQLTKCPNRRKLIYNNELCKYYQSDESQKQTQTNPIIVFEYDRFSRKIAEFLPILTPNS